MEDIRENLQDLELGKMTLHMTTKMNLLNKILIIGLYQNKKYLKKQLNFKYGQNTLIDTSRKRI